MNVLVLGGGGFIGSNLSEALIAGGCTVTVFDRPEVHPLCSPELLSRLNWFSGDFANPAQITEALRGQEVLFHLISTTLPQTSNRNPAYDVESNVVGSIRLFEAAHRANVRKIIFVSSGGTVYGIPKKLPIPETHPTDPICSYGITKLAIEKYLAFFHFYHGIDYTVFRISNPYGRYQPGKASQGVIGVFLHRAVAGKEIEIWGDGQVIRDYIHISDVVTAMMRSLEYFGNVRIFNLGSGEGHTIDELLTIIEEKLNRPLLRKYTESRSLDVPVNVLDISQAQNILGWHPRISLQEGIQLTIHQIEQDSARVIYQG